MVCLCYEGQGGAELVLAQGEWVRKPNLQCYLTKTYQSQRQLEPGWELTGRVWRCRGQSPADHQMIHWWRPLLKRGRKENVNIGIESEMIMSHNIQIKQPSIIHTDYPFEGNGGSWSQLTLGKRQGTSGQLASI